MCKPSIDLHDFKKHLWLFLFITLHYNFSTYLQSFPNQFVHILDLKYLKSLKQHVWLSFFYFTLFPLYLHPSHFPVKVEIWISTFVLLRSETHRNRWLFWNKFPSSANAGLYLEVVIGRETVKDVNNLIIINLFQKILYKLNAVFLKTFFFYCDLSDF